MYYKIKYIVKYCIANKIKLQEYITHKEGITYSWFQHLKENNICIYVLFGFSGFEKRIQTLQDVEKDLLGDLYSSIQRYKSRYYHSKKAKQIIIKGLSKMKKIKTLI